MDVSHSVCFNVAFEIISKTEILFSRRQALPVMKNGFLRSRENVNLNDFQHIMVYVLYNAVLV